jgi:hypothetical protein
MRSVIACSTVTLSFAAAFSTQALTDARVVETGKSYPSIGTAVSAAPADAIIEVSSGTYNTGQQEFYWAHRKEADSANCHVICQQVRFWTLVQR